ncbi:nuclease-related domain-containing DEAD/DEAH box helicase [Variovorax saccharolyticus]|uniref:nuclease-related domain-containing DEAD/DEAH box helicase n=1 Tax=Variovorax saccharolyticus TaxID=3053516 RepID=UPI00336A6CB3
MATLFPSLTGSALGVGQYREHEMLRLLPDVLPAGYRIYHGVATSQLYEGSQRYGELDAVVVAPCGHLAVLEIKAGTIDLSDQGPFKRYGTMRKNLHHQAHAQHQGLIGRLRGEQLGEVQVAHFLLLPDFRVADGSVGFPRERIIDASEQDSIAHILATATSHAPLDAGQIDRLCGFLSNRFAVAPDPACRHGHRMQATRRLAEGLATWVPRIHSPSGAYIVEATAGSGKTQLALALLHAAAAAGERARYVCFNRPLADHIVRLAPPRAEASSFHELAIAALRASGVQPDFASGQAFSAGVEALAAATAAADPILDLLIVDESQDFEIDWLQNLLPLLKPAGRLYVLGDSDQGIYRKDAFDLAEATRITCRDNFRSPRRIVETVNLLGLSATPIEACGPETGTEPVFHIEENDDPGGLACAARIVETLIADGERLEDIVVLSFRGREKSRLLASDYLAKRSLRRITGAFDDAGNACWRDGELLVESVYRFKGQSALIVVVCEMDFAAIDALTARKLFVAMTRAQAQLHLVLSPAAAQSVGERLEASTPA